MKNALIIGGTSGIGLNAARHLGARGVAVTITGRNTVRLARAAATLTQAGSTQVTTKGVDLYDRGQADALAAEIFSGPAFDCLVNSAGYFYPPPLPRFRGRVSQPGRFSVQ